MSAQPEAFVPKPEPPPTPYPLPYPGFPDEYTSIIPPEIENPEPLPDDPPEIENPEPLPDDNN